MNRGSIRFVYDKVLYYTIKHCPCRVQKHPRASPGCSATYAGSVIVLDTVLQKECFHVLEHIHKESSFGGVAV
jgi:hypothetical protein